MNQEELDDLQVHVGDLAAITIKNMATNEVASRVAREAYKTLLEDSDGIVQEIVDQIDWEDIRRRVENKLVDDIIFSFAEKAREKENEPWRRFL